MTTQSVRETVPVRDRPGTRSFEIAIEDGCAGAARVRVRREKERKKERHGKEREGQTLKKTSPPDVQKTVKKRKKKERKKERKKESFPC
jgi:hypothetical protein